ncbi:MAG: mercury methylation ferredoxin HgcB [Pseudomonadota bacterium]
MEKFRYIKGVATLKLDREACVGCGECTAVCPHGVLALEERKVRVRDADGCIECGACALNCATGALTVTPGVGCAAYIIQTWLKGKKSGSCAGAACC